MKCGPGRKRNGQWCLTETANYKMTNRFGQFNKDHEEAFMEAALEKYDFSTCQRPDGSYYGTRGTCRKGTPVNGVPKKEKKGKAGGGGAVNEAAAQKKAEKAFSKDVAGGGADGMIVGGGSNIGANTLMKGVGVQIEKEYGVKMDAAEANGEKVAPGYIDGFVTTRGGKSFSVSMERDGSEWVVESMEEL